MSMDWGDFSSNNGRINVVEYAKSGRTFIMLKATEGDSYRWYGGDVEHADAHARGLNVGRYGWLRPDANPAAQGRFFVNAVKHLLKPGDVVMTDFEATYRVPDPSDAVRAQQLRIFNTTVSNLLPDNELWVYTGNWYLAGKPHCQAECRRWPVVMSDYSSYGDADVPNRYRLHYVARQYTDRASFPGVPGTGDGNRFYPNAANQLVTGGHDMFAIYRSTDPGHHHWYVGAPGYWKRLASTRELLTAAANPLCVNGKTVLAVRQHKVKGRALTAAIASFSFPLTTLVRMKRDNLAIGGK